MKQALLIATLLLTPTAFCSSFTITDAYGGQNPGEAANNGDVIGLLRQFDIEKIDFTVLGNEVTAKVYVNYGQNGPDLSLGGISLGSFPTVHPGDLVIENGVQTWVVPLISHTNFGPGPGGLSAGHLYLVDGTLTAGVVLNNTTAGGYRPGEVVWGDATNAQQIGTGTVTTALAGGQQLLVTLQFSTTDTAFLAAMNDPATALHLAAATCANDIIEGAVETAPVPEPFSMGLTGAGLAALGWFARRRRGQSRLNS